MRAAVAFPSLCTGMATLPGRITVYCPEMGYGKLHHIRRTCQSRLWMIKDVIAKIARTAGDRNRLGIIARN